MDDREKKAFDCVLKSSEISLAAKGLFSIIFFEESPLTLKKVLEFVPNEDFELVEAFHELEKKRFIIKTYENLIDLKNSQ